MKTQVDVAVIGAGHAGLNAIKEIRKVTDNWVLINGGPLGTTCARIGCMPSKVAIDLADTYSTRSAPHGI
jgi:dihydrolipoamide dehydrogenase